jgi:5-methylcytosine-specific restriction endonuclease McrA
MPRFELEKLTSYEDQSLINELKRVADLIPNGTLKSNEYDRFGKVHSTTLRRRLHVDHRKAWSRNGETTLENLRSLYLECNLGKGSREE